MLKYKGYAAIVEYDDAAGILHGEVANTRDVITFQADNTADLETAFRDSVDDYLAFCAERGEEPEKPLSGQFLVRGTAELHRRVNIAAASSGMSVNAWVTQTLEKNTKKYA